MHRSPLDRLRSASSVRVRTQASRDSRGPSAMASINLHLRRIVGLGPHERDQRQIEEGHGAANGHRPSDPFPESALWLRPVTESRVPSGSISITISSPGCTTRSRNLGVGRFGETALVHLGWDRVRLAGDVHHMRLPAAQVEAGPNRRDALGRGLLSCREHAQ